jgi:hypothetical protein
MPPTTEHRRHPHEALVLFMSGANPLDDLPHGGVGGPVELLAGRNGVFHSVGLALLDLLRRVPQHRLRLQALQPLTAGEAISSASRAVALS